ncbi:MAG: GNAT family N-acetyltransferase [Candidatus Promineifilaceae bacterium]
MTKPILRDFPYSFETERLLIRGPLPGDGMLVREAVLESQVELRPWMPWAVDVPDIDAYEVIIREGRLRFLSREDLWMLLFLKDDNILIGSSGLHRIDWDVPRFEIGYWVRTAYSGNGYITEAVNGITDFAVDILGATRIEIRCDSLNIRSSAVALRAGYELEATLHREMRHHLTHALRDTLVFCKLPP